MPPQHRGNLAVANLEARLQDHRRLPERQSGRLPRRVPPVHVAVPGTQSFRARAAGGGWHADQGGQHKDRNFTKNSLEKFIKAVDKRLDEYLRRLDESDVEEATTDGSRTKNLAEKIAALREKRGRYGALLTELERSGESQISLTDPDSRAMAAHTKVAVGYNIQVAVDAKNKMIVDQEVTNQVVRG
jgi:hypothetical protein